ncbi:MAG: NADH-quinone oxidoreductase subunit NuoG [Burkholderiaceae bacterium]
MIELEIDGKKVEVAAGSMVMDAATKLGLYVPHFCYHKKLSIAANCRMCLVEVEKAPKPLPACATPVAAGMKVFTASEKAKQAQKGVMEFLLINHPLDCPICDQGGECQLQDLAVGYGPSASRYTEGKRVVFHKPMGPLISAQEMSRCIHCTRCVRFGQEIAGVMELGMAGRGEHSEIMSFVGSAVESELSGNMIDVCPVGALTSKPFRYQARTWELARRRSVSPHDSIGSNVILQTKGSKVLRVVPYEQEAVNECWISDRDRFSYEGLTSEDRLTVPMRRTADGQWHEIDWSEALSEAAKILRQASGRGVNRVRGFASPVSTVEELGLLARLIRGLQSDAVDFRPQLLEPGFDSRVSGVPTLGMRLEEVNSLERVLVVGSQLRAELPLLAQRLRQAARRGAHVHTLHAYAEPLLMPAASQMVAAPSAWVSEIDQLLHAASTTGKGDASPAARLVASMRSAPNGGEHAAIFLGAAALAHPQASLLIDKCQTLAQALGCRFGVLPVGANGVGGYIAGALPTSGGPGGAELFNETHAAYLLMHLEPALDLAMAPAAVQTLQTARDVSGVVALTAYRSAVESVASLMLPIAPFTETSGSFVNLEGRLQSFQAAVPPQGATRPGWKVLRVLGNLLDLPGFDQSSSEEVLQSLLNVASPGEILPNLPALSVTGLPREAASGGQGGFERIGEMSIYMADPIARRSSPLLETRSSSAPRVAMHPEDMAAIGASADMLLNLETAGHRVQLLPVADASLARGVVRVPIGHPGLAGINMTGGRLDVSIAKQRVAVGAA